MANKVYKQPLLGQFTNRDDYEKYMDDLAFIYKNTPVSAGLSVNKMAKMEQAKGYKLDPKTLWRAFKKRKVKIKENPTKNTSFKYTMAIREDVYDILKSSFVRRGEIVGRGLPSASELFNVSIRLMMGLPTYEILVAFPDEENVDRHVLFRPTVGGSVEAISFSKLTTTEKEMIATWVADAKKNGLGRIKEYATKYRKRYLGGNVAFYQAPIELL